MRKYVSPLAHVRISFDVYVVALSRYVTLAFLGYANAGSAVEVGVESGACAGYYWLDQAANAATKYSCGGMPSKRWVHIDLDASIPPDGGAGHVTVWRDQAQVFDGSFGPFQSATSFHLTMGVGSFAAAEAFVDDVVIDGE